jgi:hypothetical protein
MEIFFFLLNRESNINPTVRTGLRKADLEYFDFNRPILYSTSEERLLIPNDQISMAMAEPYENVAAANYGPRFLFIGFILSMAIVLITSIALRRDSEQYRRRLDYVA